MSYVCGWKKEKKGRLSHNICPIRPLSFRYPGTAGEYPQAYLGGKSATATVPGSHVHARASFGRRAIDGVAKHGRGKGQSRQRYTVYETRGLASDTWRPWPGRGSCSSTLEGKEAAREGATTINKRLMTDGADRMHRRSSTTTTLRVSAAVR